MRLLSLPWRVAVFRTGSRVVIVGRLRRLLSLQFLQSELGLNGLELQLQDFLIVLIAIRHSHHVLECFVGGGWLFARRRRNVTVAILTDAILMLLPASFTIRRTEQRFERRFWRPIGVVLVGRGCDVVSTDMVHAGCLTQGREELEYLWLWVTGEPAFSGYS